MKTVKYDPEQWVDFGKDKTAPCPSETHIVLAAAGTVSVDLGDGWRIIGHGDEFKISLPRPGKIKANQAFAVFVGIDTVVSQLGVPLTNFDKRPGLSSVERMVKSTILEANLKERLAREKRKEQDRKMNQQRVDEGLQDENPIEEEPVVDDTISDVDPDKREQVTS